jgi:hypothetical protein
VLAGAEHEALRTAERAYRRWLGHMRHLWDRFDMEFPLALPPEIGPLIDAGAAFAGTAPGFRQYVADHAESIGATYVCCDVAFGDVSFEEAMQTTELIGREVIPSSSGDR